MFKKIKAIFKAPLQVQFLKSENYTQLIELRLVRKLIDQHKADMVEYLPILRANAMVDNGHMDIVNRKLLQCQFCEELDYKHKTTCKVLGLQKIC